MSLIDRHGRILGKVNLIDGIAAALLLSLFPLGVGAFLMFRPKAPTITAISPNQVAEHQRATLQITGEDIRPFLEARFGNTTSGGFFVESPTSARVIVPNLPAGTYDLTLMDKGRDVFSMPAALTVMGERWASLNEADVQVLGSFVALAADEAGMVSAGSAVTEAGGSRKTGEVITVQAAAAEMQQIKVSALREERGITVKSASISVPIPGQFRVPAIIRLRCTVSQGECKLGEAIVSAGRLIVLQISGSKPLRFLIDEVRPADQRVTFPPSSPAIADVKVRFVAEREVIAAMKLGDIDIAGFGLVAEADRARLIEIGIDRQATPALVTPEGLLRRTFQVQQPVVAVTGTVRVPVVYDPAGWIYKERTVKIGATFHFETIAGGMSGLIVQVNLIPKK